MNTLSIRPRIKQPSETRSRVPKAILALSIRKLDAGVVSNINVWDKLVIACMRSVLYGWRGAQLHRYI